MLDFGILGMNARNLHYIKKFNPKKAIRLADNKYKTKRFLSQRDIPVPATYGLIKNRNELYSYDFSQIPSDEFMVKPNKGSRGRGIKRVQLIDGPSQHGFMPSFNMFDKMFGRQSDYPDQWYKMGSEEVDDYAFRRYLVDILDGKNSLSAMHDEILLEELMLPGSGFEALCAHGLADVRVVIFNLIPVIAYTRVPTAKSDGKANLARGADALGVEVGTGKIVTAYTHGKTYLQKFPEPYADLAHTHVPYWDDILLYSSKVQYFANLGYLALDRVITDDGPKLLEINARAGLKIQNVLGIPLRQRLQKVGDIKVTTPEKGVEIAQTLFTLHKAPVVTMSKVIHLSQHGKLLVHQNNDKQSHDVIISVNLDKKSNTLSSELYEQVGQSGTKTQVLFTDQRIKLSNLTWKEDKKLGKNTIVLGREAVADYYVKPINKIFTSITFINPKRIAKSELDDLHILDKKISKFSKILNTSRILMPVNYLDELDEFLTRNGRYNPRFKYRWPALSKLNEVEDALKVLNDQFFTLGGLQCDFAQLYRGKIGELLDKTMLLKAYRNQNFAAVQAANEGLFGAMQPDLIELSRYTLSQASIQQKYLLGDKLTQTEIRDRILAYLKKHDIKGVKLQFDSNGTSRMSVLKGKQITVRVGLGAGFREHELEATLAHEIDVHVRRYLNGAATGWDLLKSGTSKYVTDEEGLAIYMSEQYLPEGYIKLGRYAKYYLLSQADQHTFAGLVEMIMAIPGKTLTGAFKTTLRIKKGVQKTGVVQAGAAYRKDKIYLDGYRRVTERIEGGGDVEQLMIGKIKIDDLQYIR